MTEDDAAVLRQSLIREMVALGFLAGVLWALGPGRIYGQAIAHKIRARFRPPDPFEGEVRKFANQITSWDHEQTIATDRKAAGGGPCGCGGLPPARHRRHPDVNADDTGGVHRRRRDGRADGSADHRERRHDPGHRAGPLRSGCHCRRRPVSGRLNAMSTPQPPWQPQQPQQPPATAPEPAYTPEQATEAVNQIQADGGTDAAPTVEQMAEALASQKFQQQISGYEAQMNAALAAAAQMQQQFNAQVQAMQAQLASVRAQAGPPDAVNLASALATRVQNIAAANPDLPAGHFAGVISQAAALKDEVQQVAEGTGSTDRVAQLASSVSQFFTRIHARTSGKVLEGMGTALDEAERIVEELPKLAPVALPAISAVVSAV